MATVVTVTLHQKRSVPSDYRVLSEITASSHIQKEVFTVKKTGTGAYTYQHVATVADVENLPIVEPTPVGDLYLRDDVTVDFTEVTPAEEHAAAIKVGLQELVTDYASSVDDFIGEDTGLVITS